MTAPNGPGGPLTGDDRACRWMEQLLSAYVDHEVSAHEARTVEAHLLHCAGCAAHVRRLRAQARALEAELRRGLAAAPTTIGRPRLPEQRVSRVGGLLSVGLLALVAVLAVVLLPRTLTTVPPPPLPATQPPAPATQPAVPGQPPAAPGGGAAGHVLLAHVAGAIDPLAAEYIDRVVAEAEQQHASLLVLTLDSPGGLDSSMRRSVQALLNSPVPSVVYVAPSGARAASAGVFVAQAANLVAMAPGTTIGAAHPVQPTAGELQGDLRDKAVNDAAAYAASIAQQRGRNDAWIRDAVHQSASLTASEAVDQHAADVLAADVPSLLDELDGRTLTTAGGPVTLQTRGAAVDELAMGPVELLAHRVFDPNVAYLLLTIGFFAILVELLHPGALLPGVTGVLSLVLAFVAFAALPMNWGGVVLILAAVVLFVVDVKATRHGALTLAGVVCFVVGSLLLYTPVGPRSPTLPDVSVAWPVLLVTAGAGAALGALVVGTAVRTAKRPAITGMQDLAGALGTARGALDPDGTVHVGGQLWSARLRSGRLDSGERVRVLARKGLILEVEPAGIGAAERKGAAQ
jgi:membrane-bound serine protease (ClpP class)